MKKAKYLLLSTLIFSSLSVTQITSANNSEEIQFNSCSEAWAAGYANIKHGEVGYSSKLDRDNDGIACELKYDTKGEYKREGQPLNKIKATEPEVETTPELNEASETSTLENSSQPNETEEATPTEESSANNPNNTETSENNSKTEETKKETHEYHTKKALPKTSAVK